MKNVVSFLRDESGATAIEYALIVAVIGGAIAAIGPTLKSMITGAFSSAATAVAPASSS